MQTFLNLCKSLYREGGLSGEITSTQNQTGEANRVVNWIANSYQEILNDQSLNWKFQRGSVAVQLTIGKGDYTFDELNLATGAQWDTRSMRVASSADLSDETHLIPMRFPEFRDYWLFSSRRTVQSRPLNATVDDETKLRVAPLPDQAYWLVLQYLNQPTALVSDDDVPSVIPARFQNVILWRALRHYGMFEQAPEVVVRADHMYQQMMVQLEMDQGEEVVVGGAIC